VGGRAHVLALVLALALALALVLVPALVLEWGALALDYHRNCHQG